MGRLAIGVREVAKSSRFWWRQRSFVPHEIVRDVLGERLFVSIRDVDARDWYERSSYLVGDWPEMRYLRDHMIEEGDVVIDCGSHQGITAMLMARWVGPTGTVIAIDPVKHNIEVAAQNLQLNKVENVRLIETAVGRRTSQARIGLGTNIQVGASFVGSSVQVIPLDDLIDLRPTLLKFDVEGSEADVFAGSVRLLATRPKIAMELHVEALEKFGHSATEVLDLLRGEGYELWVQWNDHTDPVRLSESEVVRHRAHIFGFPKPRPA